MLMTTDRTKRPGFIMAELIVGTALLGLALGALAVSLQGVSMFNDVQWMRQRCVAAAEAQLDSLATFGAAIDEAEIKRLWPGVEVEADRTPGDPPWNGLELLRVTATGWAGGRRVAVQLDRYVRTDHP